MTSLNSRKEADDVYALGIARKATPLDHLESRYRDFQKRMMTNTYLPPSEPVASTSNSSRPRQVLATTASSIPASSSSRQTSSRTGTTLGGTSTGLPSAALNSRLQIFVDPTGEQAEAAEGNEWNDLGTRKTRIKENVPEVKKMVGTTIKQAGKTKRLATAAAGSSSGTSTSGSSSSKIVPFRDPGPGDMPPPSSLPPVQKKKVQSVVSKAPTKGFSIFVDEEKPDAVPKKKEQEAVAKAPTSSRGFSIFVDEDANDSPAAGAAVSNSTSASDTPKFTPFRDEVSFIFFYLLTFFWTEECMYAFSYPISPRLLHL